MPNTYADATLALQALAGAGFRNVYVQRGDASGDIPHVLSALAVKPTYGVLVWMERTPGLKEAGWRTPTIRAITSRRTGLRM